MRHVTDDTIKEIIISKILTIPTELSVITYKVPTNDLNTDNVDRFIKDSVMGRSNIIISNRDKAALVNHFNVNDIIDPGIYVLVNSITAFKQYTQHQDVVINNVVYDSIAKHSLIYDTAGSIFSSLLTKNKKMLFSDDPKIAILYNDPESRYNTTTLISKARSKYYTPPNQLMQEV